MNRERLEKLATHLETGTLGHEVFDFDVYNSNIDEHTQRYVMSAGTCGTRGCAIGECPIAFPEDWKFDARGLPQLKSREKEFYSMVMDNTEEFFDISHRDAIHLFTPDLQTPQTRGGKDLDRYATRFEVAANIRAFIERMK